MPSRAAKKAVFALWLHPASPAREFFREIIERLARDFDAPVFPPHLTLAVRDTRPDPPLAIRSDPIRLRPSGIFFSPAFTKTLFVRFESTAALERLVRSVGGSTAGFDPHLSLLYGKLTLAEKARLAASISLPFSAVRFDQLSVVRCPSPTESRSEVEAWEYFERVRLCRRPKSSTRANEIQHKQPGGRIRRRNRARAAPSY